MSASSAAMPSSASVYTTSAFWEGLWRSSGIQAVGLFVIAYVIYGSQPQIGASADALVAFYDSNRTRILIAAVFSGMAILNLMWFAAALRTTLADAGQDGWGAAATASSAALGALFLLFTTVGAALAYSIAGAGNHALTSGLNDFAWASVVLSSDVSASRDLRCSSPEMSRTTGNKLACCNLRKSSHKKSLTPKSRARAVNTSDRSSEANSCSQSGC